MSMLGRAILLTGLPSTCGLFIFNYIFMQQRRRNTLFEYVSITLTRLVISPAAYTHSCLTALFPGLSRRAGTRKVKPIWILLEQETVSSSGISWAICKSAPCSRQTTTPAPHHSVFLQAGCPSCRPTNSVKALKALKAPAAYIMELFFYGIGTSSCPSRVAIFPCCWTDFIK